jgi:AcrR family transcriptional regulator
VTSRRARADPRPETPRQRMVRSASALIRERGIHGVGMRQVVEHSQTPRGSLQTYFPGGKAQLAAEAAELGVAEFPSGFSAAAQADTLARAVAEVLGPWRDVLTAHRYTIGCPVAPTVIDGIDDERLQRFTNTVFENWTDKSAAIFERFGFSERDARTAAWSFVSAVEGAVLISRSRRDLSAFDAVQTTFGNLVSPP